MGQVPALLLIRTAAGPKRELLRLRESLVSAKMGSKARDGTSPVIEARPVLFALQVFSAEESAEPNVRAVFQMSSWAVCIVMIGGWKEQAAGLLGASRRPLHRVKTEACSMVCGTRANNWSPQISIQLAEAFEAQRRLTWQLPGTVVQVRQNQKKQVWPAFVAQAVKARRVSWFRTRS